ncbi:EthD family reductase [Pseudonocardia broussonetiae]|uniref:EthD family reductase n=1 Tax=Pseudonocardia broussonetiae TaxID=2736640 RepID=UPI001F0343D2|nr:EthD family reductase [Pseudonocardia broussonetiae]
MYQLTALYNHPEDPAAFDKHYTEVHAEIAKKIPGILRYTISHPGPGPEGDKPPYYLVAVLDFADEASFGAGMGGEQGQAAVADLPNFAGAGVTLLTGPANEA